MGFVPRCTCLVVVLVLAMMVRIDAINIIEMNDTWCGKETDAKLHDSSGNSVNTFTFVPIKPGWYVFSACDGTTRWQVQVDSTKGNKGYIDSGVIDRGTCGTQSNGVIWRIYVTNTTDAKLTFVAGTTKANVPTMKVRFICPEPAFCITQVSTTLAGSYTLKPALTGTYTVHDCASGVDTWLHAVLERDVKSIMFSDEAEVIAENLGLKIGGCGYQWKQTVSLQWPSVPYGLYAYRGGFCDGVAFFGMGGNAAQQNRVILHFTEGYGDGEIYRPHMVANEVDADNCGGESMGQSEEIILTHTQVLHVLVTLNLDNPATSPLDTRTTTAIETTFVCPATTTPAPTASPISPPTSNPSVSPQTQSPTSAPSHFATIIQTDTTTVTPTVSLTTAPSSSSLTLSPSPSPSLVPSPSLSLSPSPSPPLETPSTIISPIIFTSTTTSPSASTSAGSLLPSPTTSPIPPTTSTPHPPTTSPSTTSPTTLPHAAPTHKQASPPTTISRSPSSSPVVLVASTKQDEDDSGMWIGVAIAIIICACVVVGCVVCGVRRQRQKNSHHATISGGTRTPAPHFGFIPGMIRGANYHDTSDATQTFQNMAFNPTSNALQGDVVYDTNPDAGNGDVVYTVNAVDDFDGFGDREGTSSNQQTYSQPSKKKTNASPDSQQIYSQPNKKKADNSNDTQQIYSQPSKKTTNNNSDNQQNYSQPSTKAAHSSKTRQVYSQPPTTTPTTTTTTTTTTMKQSANDSSSKNSGEVIYDANATETTQQQGTLKSTNVRFEKWGNAATSTSTTQGEVVYTTSDKSMYDAQHEDGDDETADVCTQVSKETKKGKKIVTPMPKYVGSESTEDDQLMYTFIDPFEDGGNSVSTNEYAAIGGGSVTYASLEPNNDGGNSYKTLHPDVDVDESQHQYAVLNPHTRSKKTSYQNVDVEVAHKTNALLHSGLDRVAAESALRKAVGGDGSVIGYLVRPKEGMNVLVLSVLISKTKFVHDIITIEKDGSYLCNEFRGSDLSRVAAQVANKLKKKYKAKRTTPVLMKHSRSRLASVGDQDC